MIERDPVELTEVYKRAMEAIQPVLDQAFPADEVAMGTCHRYWARKKALLAERGIEWKSPAEMNPDIRFD